MTWNPLRTWAAGLAVCVLGVAVVGAFEDDPGQRVALSAPSDTDSVPVPSSTESVVPPVVVVKTVVVKQRIPFAKRVVKDASLRRGVTKVVTRGHSGYRVRTYEYTYRDGTLVRRRPISVRVTRKPVTQVTHVGTRAASPKHKGGCDPNYSGCVPIASDVDCAGGSGNGPAYVDGPVRVIGNDIYDLDRDNDGVACE